ncbi:hypothetical protein DEU56DRAFT_789986 [Suillus clintonianus]|uniref:uncharacterized protein n=1 Tax=Suillus clintonianus TaxID=1904413 RepID=UPI001B87B828|nr:uncharacterized protein DEU56DRAFT_789986 [Suillus clintonianus]KAG2144515.1 hypothetical protein DEU56DRAFT_789986 [Suillus clintonianus]
MLQETSAKLTKLHNRRPEYISVTQAITGCSSEIDRYLIDCLWSSQMQNHRDMHEISVILQQQQDHQKLLMTMQSLIIHGQSSVGPTATQSIGAVELGCVTLVDATGHEHPISVNFCTSFQQLHEMFQVLFKRDSIEARIQRQYMEEGQHDLCIDDDKQVTRLTRHEWPNIEAGTKIVMRVIIEQSTPSSAQIDYRCQFCSAVNRASLGSKCSIDCRVCKRRFQISCEPFYAEGDIPDTEVHYLIRNFLVQQTVVATMSEMIQRREYLQAGINAFEQSIQTVLAQTTRGFPDELWSARLEKMRKELHSRKVLFLRVNQAIQLVPNTPGVSNISVLPDVARRKTSGPSQLSMPGQAHPINSRQDGQIRRPGVCPTRSSPIPQWLI